MKRILFFFIGILPMLIFSQEVQNSVKKQVAILEPVVVTKQVTTMHRSMVRGEMVKAIGRQDGYVAFTRHDIDQIMNEHNFQASGMVSEETRKRLGAMQGVDYVCITKITIDGNSFYLEASLVNIETGQISNPASQFGELRDGSLGRMVDACEKLAAELVGKKQYTAQTLDDCKVNLSLFVWYAKEKNYADAYEPWMKVYTECPSLSKNIYSLGVRILEWKIKQATTQEEFNVTFDQLMKLYDDRIKYFGNDSKKPTPVILEEKVSKYNEYFPNGE
ncbi:MAG: hypothetical protein IKV26_05310 [Paludibacteraceae bacterium]|nr:hypothetical protein [Paludibacteraceae bacterium]